MKFIKLWWTRSSPYIYRGKRIVITTRAWDDWRYTAVCKLATQSIQNGVIITRLTAQLRAALAGDV